MRAINSSLVDKVWQEITTYPPGRVEDEARAFLHRQPHVATFCGVVTKEFDLAAQKAALGLTFLLFKVLETSLGAAFPPVARDRIQGAYEATTEWLERWEGADPQIFLRSVQGEGELPRPNLVAYLLTVFYGGDAESAEYDQEVRASLFLLLKTLTDALDIREVERGSG